MISEENYGHDHSAHDESRSRRTEGQEGRPRQHRQRVHRGDARPAYSSDAQRPYRSNYERREGGYNREGGNYGRREGGYNRQGYGRREGGYERREGQGYERREGGYNRQNRPQGKPFFKKTGKRRIDYSDATLDPNKPIRLNRYLANAGICSRRDADKYIEAGVVSVNGEVVTTLGTRVLRTDVVLFHDTLVRPEKKVYILLNKPKGYVTTSDDPQNRKTVMDLVANVCPERIYPIGRLDRNTTGVLLLTNDGELAEKLMHPQYLKKKIYHVTLDKNVTAADLRQIAEGITLEDGPIRADHVEYASPTDKKQVGIELHSGRNRIVRRIFESLGYHVVKLDRVFYAGLTKKNVKRGDWRFLTQEEVNFLKMGSFE